MLFNILSNLLNNKPAESQGFGLLPYGQNKADGSHDHRRNTGKDRTPAQKAADAAKSAQSAKS